MRKVKLGDLVTVMNEREDNPSRSKYDRFVGLEHYDSGSISITRWGSTEMLVSAMKVFHRGDILVARRNVYLKRASSVDFDGITSGDSIILHVNDEQYKAIVPFVLNTDSFWDYADQHSDGSMSKRLAPKTMLEYEFTLPDDEEVERLSTLLWAMERTKTAYKNLIAKTDELVKSQFVEMFGDPVNNDMNWPLVALRDCLNGIDSGKSLNCEGHPRSGESPAVLKLSAVTYGKYDPAENKELPSEDAFISNLEVRAGDLLFSRKNTREYVGMTAIVRETPRNLMLPDLIFRLLPKDCIRTEYLHQLFNHTQYRPVISGLASGSAGSMPNISKQRLLALEIPLPPIDRQLDIEPFVEQSDKSKFVARQATSNLKTYGIL